jgi:hypothetical protein
MAFTRLNGTTIYDDGWAVVSNSSDEATGHIFVTAWDGDITVVVLSLASV